MPKRLFPFILLLIAAGVLAVVFLSPRSPLNKQAETLPYPVVSTSPTGLVLPLVDLKGMWYSEEDTLKFAAEVTDNHIKIAMISPNTQDGTDGESLAYWDGTFETSGMPGETITSHKNKTEFVLSQSDDKDFTIEDGKIHFQFRMDSLGYTKNVVLAHA